MIQTKLKTYIDIRSATQFGDMFIKKLHYLKSLREPIVDYPSHAPQRYSALTLYLESE